MNKSIEKQPIDQKTREEVINPESSFLVQAPAGSGKTTTLARRILHLLTVVEDPKEIIAISFTNKAAAEMHEKVLEQYKEPKNGNKSASCSLSFIVSFTTASYIS